MEFSIEEKIKDVLAELEPYVAGHGGSITLVDFDVATGMVRVQLEGTCEGCSLSQITLKYGLEDMLKKKIPQVTQVVPV